MKVLAPLTRYPPSTRRANVRMPAIGARAGLGDPECGYALATDRRRQESLLLVLGPELPHRRVAIDIARRCRRPVLRATARQLLGEHGVLHIAAASAAVLHRVLQPEQAQLRHAREHRVGKPAGLLPLGRVRPKLLGHEGSDLAAQRLVSIGERRGRAAGDRGLSTRCPSHRPRRRRRDRVAWPPCLRRREHHARDQPPPPAPVAGSSPKCSDSSPLNGDRSSQGEEKPTA